MNQRSVPPARVRPLRLADLQEVLRIQAECYTEIVPESLASLQAKARACPGTCFAAAVGDGMVGYLIAVPVRYPHLPALDAATCDVAPDADTLYLHDLAMAPAGRGTGAARCLVRAAMQAGKAAGLRSACLVAIQGSAPYWRQFGFEPVAVPHPRAGAKLASYGASAQLMAAPL